MPPPTSDDVDLLTRAVIDNDLIDYVKSLNERDLRAVVPEAQEVSVVAGCGRVSEEEVELTAECVFVTVETDSAGVIQEVIPACETKQVVTEPEARMETRRSARIKKATTTSSADPVTIKIKKVGTTFNITERGDIMKKRKCDDPADGLASSKRQNDRSEVNFEGQFMWQPSNRAAKPVLARQITPPLQQIEDKCDSEVKKEVKLEGEKDEVCDVEEEEEEDGVEWDRPWEPSEIVCLDHFVTPGRVVGAPVTLPGLEAPPPQYVGELTRNPHFIVGVNPTTDMLISLAPIDLNA